MKKHTLINYHTWRDIPIKLFNSISLIANDQNKSDDEKNLHLVALFTDLTIEDVRRLTTEVYNEALFEISTFFNDKIQINKNARFKHLNINGKEYDVLSKIEKLTVAQYVDFQQYVKEKPQSLAKVLSIFIIPKGKTYNEGYEIEDVIEELNNNLDIVTANEISAFFLSKLRKSTKLLVTRFKLMMMMRTLGMKKPIRKATMRMIKAMESFLGSI